MCSVDSPARISQKTPVHLTKSRREVEVSQSSLKCNLYIPVCDTISKMQLYIREHMTYQTECAPLQRLFIKMYACTCVYTGVHWYT